MLEDFPIWKKNFDAEILSAEKERDERRKIWAEKMEAES
jgi:hypothetical protein